MTAEVRFLPLPGDRRQAMDLLLLADPDPAMIGRYLDRCDLFVLREGDVILAQAAVLPMADGACELKNLAVREERQGLGLGSRLVRELFAAYAARGYTRMLVGTSDRGRDFYRRLGFADCGVLPGFFLQYAEPVIEEGVLCRDMYMLEAVIPPQGEETSAGQSRDPF